MTARALNDFRRAQADIVTLAQRDIESFWASLDLENPKKAAKLTRAFVPELIAEYGEIGAAVASDFYQELREASNVKSSYSSVLADPIPKEQSLKTTGWALGPLFVDDADVALSNITGAVDRLVRQAGRSTITENAYRDPERVRYARVPTKGDTCQFCLMLASRGAVYLSEASAGGHEDFHDRCYCEPVVVWSAEDYDTLKETGYDPDALYQQYLDTEPS